ncbi:glycosyltransferase family 4 protein [Aquiflexum gelatinilyticum]|uniref:Glycosyltransferase family 4 protein n=1 Tax=Aquiflexum gelatinilyticum TaxID=2961943 RepID=A0A9X2T3L1_9BACT|nr:glycosyltransferase family 4 protein [Aquiflexum gelatinilyticum]MCR9016490.1 glycosyltransferase family 4 protein [Aquiflexum gelatinilyticum]
MTKKRKILFYQDQTLDFFVEGGIPLGGSAIESFVWMKSLHELGFKVYQFQKSSDNRILKNDMLWINIVKTYDDRIRRKWYWYWYRLPIVFFVLLRYRFDYLYTAIPTWETYYYGRLCKILGIKHIVRIASDNITSRRDGINQAEIDLIFKGISSADVISVQNVFQQKSIKKRIPSSNVVLIYNPIVIDKFFFKPKDKMGGYIAWVANFRDVKNMALLYEIASKLPSDRFKIAGQPLIPLEPETEDSLKKLKTLCNVDFLGRIEQSEILSFYRGAKFLLNTSKFEGFSNTFLEAMITGTPILTTPKVNPDEIISKFDLGVIYSNAEDLTAYLANLSESAYLQKSVNCVKYVGTKHDHIALGKKLIDIISEK